TFVILTIPQSQPLVEMDRTHIGEVCLASGSNGRAARASLDEEASCDRFTRANGQRRPHALDKTAAPTLEPQLLGRHALSDLSTFPDLLLDYQEYLFLISCWT